MNPEQRGPLAAVLEQAEDFEIVETLHDAREAAVRRAEYGADLLIIDEQVAGLDDDTTRRRLVEEAPVPTLFLVSDADEHNAQTQAVTRVDRELVARDDAFSRSHLVARLHTLASKCAEQKRTVTSRSLSEALERARSTAQRMGMSAVTTQLASWPLDLVLLVGGQGSIAQLRELLPVIASVPVPILIALSPEEQASISGRDRLGLEPHVDMEALSRPVLIRHAHDVMVATVNSSIRIVEDAIQVGPGRLELPALINSMAAIGSCGLTVLLSSEDESLANELAGAANADGLTVAVSPDDCRAPNAPRAALSWGITENVVSLNELGWLLGHTMPRRSGAL